MASRSRQPHLLHHSLQLATKSEALVVLTSTLGCTVTWLGAQFVYTNLADQPASDDADASLEGSAGVVLVSWLRDIALWKSEIRRSTVSWANPLVPPLEFMSLDDQPFTSRFC